MTTREGLLVERVALPGRPTDVLVGPGAREAVAAAVRERFPRAVRYGLVVDAAVARLWGARGGLPAIDGLEDVTWSPPAGEAAKERDVLSDAQDRLLDLRRDEPVVAVGGGALLDLAGFAAATLRRGLPWIAVPTTVLAMADAAIGGKVAVNHPRGKNLLGAFHPPSLVLADVAYVATLPRRERLSGLAEAYKAGRVGDPALLASLRRGPPADEAAWADVVLRALAVKARIVERDEMDAGPRRALNYGHTVGHALERVLGPDAIRHGEAVAVGMGVAGRLARGRGLVPEGFVERQSDDLARLGLPTRIPEGLPIGGLLDAIALDKKRRAGATHAFVLPSGDVGVVVVEDVRDEEILEAIENRS